MWDFFTDLGGLLWWIFIRFCKTDLDEEQSEKYQARNLFLIIIIVFLITSIQFVFELV